MTTLATNEKPIHKPSCAYLCSGDELPPRECDCGAVLKLTLGERSARILLRAIGRLDGNEVDEAKTLGLTDALETFVGKDSK